MQDPPGLILRALIQKAASQRGFSVELGVSGAWLGFSSTTAPGEVWIAGSSANGPFVLSATHAGVAAVLASSFAPSPTPGPSGPAILLADDEALTAAVDRSWKLAMSLPSTPLAAFEAAVAGMPRATEAERLVVQRIGQDRFRDALMFYWSGRCPLTGVTDAALLRASHIISWSDCETDAERLKVENGLLLSSLWDAAFDAGLVTFGNDGAPIASPLLSCEARAALNFPATQVAINLTAGHRVRLAVHRRETFKGR